MKERKAHLLDKPKGNERPANVIFFDTETQQTDIDTRTQKHTLKIGVVQHYRAVDDDRLRLQSELVFRHNAEFWDYVDGRCRQKTTTYLTAHNIVFDLAVLNGFSELAERGWELESFYTKGMVSIFRWKNGTRKITGIDNGNLFPGKLRLWGDILGFPKGEVDFDTVSEDDLIVYCRRDVEIMVKCWLTWLDFLDVQDCGSFRVTVGSTAFSAWRHRFLKAKVHIHDNPLAMMLERESYKGGRVEVLYKGRLDDGPFYYLDINNMYGYVLTRYTYPSGIWDAKETDSISMLIKKLEKYAITARVTINTTEPYFPYKFNGHTCYPVGRFTTTLTTPEIHLCFQRGWMEAVHAIAWYRQEPLFAEYVKTFYDLRMKYRKEGNSGFAQICKLLVNSLYGKFGQQGFEQKVIGKTDIQDIWTESVLDIVTQEFYRHIALGGQIYEERKTGESYNSFTAIAAHVTAYARLYLYRLCLLVPHGHVFYMDTDSLIVDKVGKEHLAALMDENTLGSLKVELESPWVEINAPKDYAMEGRSRMKGVTPGSKEVQPGIFEVTQWERLNGMIRRGTSNGYYTRKGLKHQRRNITSGVVLPSGWVQPFEIDLPASVVPVDWSAPIDQP